MKIILFVQFDFFYHWRSRPESASLRPPSWEIWRTPPSGCLDSQPVTWSRRTSGSSLPAASTVSVGNVCWHRAPISWLGKVYSALTLSSNKVQWHESVFSGYVKDDFIFKRYMWIPLFFLMLTSVDQFSIHNRVPERMLFVDLWAEEKEAFRSVRRLRRWPD